MRIARWTSLLALLVVASIAAPAWAAQLAPSYVSSEPSNGEELHQAPDQVEVTFSEPLDESSELTVEDACGRDVDDDAVTIDGSTMSVGLSLKPSGHYEVTYVARGLAGVTGETEGSFHFMVHGGTACDGKKKRHDHDKDKDKHKDHDRDRDHNRHDDDDMNHDDDDHSDMDHDSMSSTDHDSMDHDSMTGRRHGGNHAGMDHNGRGKHNGNHAKHTKPPVAEPPGENAFATPEGGTPAPAGGTAVLMALGLSLALGGVGGWFLRVSARP